MDTGAEHAGGLGRSGQTLGRTGGQTHELGRTGRRADAIINLG